jgi:hypothetical protein
VVVLAFAFARGKSDSSSTATPKAGGTAVVSVAAPTPSEAALSPCAQVQSALPVQLEGYLPRIVYPYPDASAPVVAWGDPAIIFQCGVPKPADLKPESTALGYQVNGDIYWFQTSDSKNNIFTAVDRAVFIRVTVPKAYPQPPLPTLSDAIASVLPAVCHFPGDESRAPSTPTPSRAPGSPLSTATPTPSGPIGPLCTQRS